MSQHNDPLDDNHIHDLLTHLDVSPAAGFKADLRRRLRARLEEGAAAHAAAQGSARSNGHRGQVKHHRRIEWEIDDFALGESREPPKRRIDWSGAFSYVMASLIILLLAGALILPVLRDAAVREIAASLDDSAEDTREVYGVEEAIDSPGEPAWCPVGGVGAMPEPGTLRIAYVRDGQILVQHAYPEYMDAPALIADLTDAETAFISDDGAVIVFTRAVGRYETELWAIDADGTNARRLLSDDDIRGLAPRVRTTGFKPDQIAFLSGTHRFAFVVAPLSPQKSEPEDLWLIDADTAQLANLVPTGADGTFTLSPDGQQIAVSTHHHLTLVNADGTQRRDDVLDAYGPLRPGANYGLPEATWTQDGQAVIVPLLESADPHSQHDSEVAMWYIPAASAGGGDPLELATLTAYWPSVHISPDAQRVAYWFTDSRFSNRRTLMVANVDGSEPHEMLTGDRIDFVSWAPDSRHYLWHDGASHLLLLGDACSGESIPVVDTSLAEIHVTWLDDLQFLISVKTTPPTPYMMGDEYPITRDEVYLARLDGTVTLIGESWASFDAALLADY